MLCDLSEIFDLHWCIIGDFNELAKPSEKQGRISHPCTKYRRLNHFLDQSNAISVPGNGSIYTWKKHIHTHLIYEWLDRANVCKIGWRCIRNHLWCMGHLYARTIVPLF